MILFCFVLFLNDVTRFCRKDTEKEPPTDETQYFKNPLITATRTDSELASNWA